MARLVMPPAAMPTPGMALSNFAVVLHAIIALCSLAVIIGMAYTKRKVGNRESRKRKASEEEAAAKVLRKLYANDAIAKALEWYDNGNGGDGKRSLNQASKKFGVPYATLHRHQQNPLLLGRDSGPQPAIPREAEERLIQTAMDHWRNGMALNNDQLKWFILQVSLPDLIRVATTNLSNETSLTYFPPLLQAVIHVPEMQRSSAAKKWVKKGTVTYGWYRRFLAPRTHPCTSNTGVRRHAAELHS